MGKTYTDIDEAMSDFLRSQHLFFVATAPLSPDGHVNLSPKGLDTFAILSPQTVAYLDLTGSGIETVAHVKENGRIVLMFCAFAGAPKIVRLHGLADVIEPGHLEFESLLPHFPRFDAVRSIVRVRLTRISDSCGYGVPHYEFASERDQLSQWAARQGPDGIRAYQEQKNARTIDGLPGLRPK